MRIWCQVLHVLRGICHLFIILQSETKKNKKLELHLAFIWLDFHRMWPFIFFLYIYIYITYILILSGLCELLGAAQFWHIAVPKATKVTFCCLLFSKLPLAILAKLSQWKKNSSRPRNGFPHSWEQNKATGAAHFCEGMVFVFIPWAKCFRSFFLMRLGDTQAVLGCDSAVWFVFPSCHLFICCTTNKSASFSFCWYCALVWKTDGAKYLMGGRKCVWWENGAGKKVWDLSNLS